MNPLTKTFGALAIVGTLGGCAESIALGAAALANDKGVSGLGVAAIALGTFSAVKYVENLQRQGKCTVYGQPFNDGTGAIWLRDSKFEPRVTTFLKCNPEDFGRGELEKVLIDPRFSSVQVGPPPRQQRRGSGIRNYTRGW